ncbi:MAG TPA: TylF/MycF/NovP-related O-methyltransferase [Verrucomicrobiae bacterium]|jgi:hypothetical protein|nr:TylF/MycF/NovP-related O-methyltransferase [Verrucomicrobiae bacterium]
MKLPKLLRKSTPPARGAASIVLDGEVSEEILSAKELLESGRGAEAFAALNRLKARRQPVRHADYLRAHYFLQANLPGDAVVALQEELRWFPDSKGAQEHLRRLAPPPAADSVSDPEFARLLSIIRPYSMLGEPRLWSLFQLGKAVGSEDLPGNFVECGVAGGGSSALLAAVMTTHGRRPRWMYSCDTFSGLPEASAVDTHDGVTAQSAGWGAGTCAAPESSLREVCGKLGVNDRVRAVRGFFADTLPAARAEIGPIALLHMDGDWHESTRNILDNLFDNVVAGGRIQIDDYGYWQGCKLALDEFQRERGLKFELHRIDETGVWMRK